MLHLLLGQLLKVQIIDIYLILIGAKTEGWFWKEIGVNNDIVEKQTLLASKFEIL